MPYTPRRTRSTPGTSPPRRRELSPPVRATAWSRADAALAAWRGEPYPDGAEVNTLRLETDRLNELWVAVQEARADTLIGLGRPEEVVRTLRDIAPDHPFRERLWGQLCLAQYQSGRQADALATLRALRDRLGEELGVDPSPQIRALEAAILAQDETLQLPNGPSSRPLEPQTAAPPLPSRRDSLHAVSESAYRSNTLATVGREAPLAAVDDFVARLRTGTASSVLISGEAGIGKTHLVQEAIARANRAGVRVVFGRTHEADVAPAFWPWLPVLRAVAGPTPDPDVARLVGTAMTEASTDSGAAALRTYDAVCRALTSAAASAPLLVVLEDLQWADTSSLRLLAYAAEALEDTAVGLLITRRTPSELPSEPHSAALAALARHGVIRIPLGGLSGQAVTSLLSERVGEHDPSLAAVLSRRTVGNPFYLIEMARLLAARGTTDPAEAALLPVPDGVRDVIRLRLDRMPADALEVLQHAAALGGRIDPDSVAATTGRAVLEVLDQLDLCVASGLVVGEGGGYDFAHALTRESVYAEMPVGRRLRIHSALARTLGQRAETDPELIPEVATTPSWRLRSDPTSPRWLSIPWSARPYKPSNATPSPRPR